MLSFHKIKAFFQHLRCACPGRTLMYHMCGNIINKVVYGYWLRMQVNDISLQCLYDNFLQVGKSNSRADIKRQASKPRRWWFVWLSRVQRSVLQLCGHGSWHYTHLGIFYCHQISSKISQNEIHMTGASANRGAKVLRNVFDSPPKMLVTNIPIYILELRRINH